MQSLKHPLALIFIVFTFCNNIWAQIDTNKRYISKLIFKSEIEFRDISVVFQDSSSQLVFHEDSLENIAFYKNDKLTLKIHLDEFELQINEFSSFFDYCDFTYEVTFWIAKQKTQCTNIVIWSSRGNTYAGTANCVEVSTGKSPRNYIDIVSRGKISFDQKIYKILQP